ncbi:MAG: TonB-dependent receptor plug domain-containing protein [Muribaculaceae bacterium]|nr:TonB-dependent receptor plug domain-containing protein [Muribaculaceae bacterium]
MTMRLFIYVLMTICSLAAVAADPGVILRNVDYTGRRPMKDIGVNRTVFDSLSLRDNVAMSMADVLAYNSSVYVKEHGRASLSTVAFRGTSPSHTQVTWNGMRINSPMLGMTDFSTIPAYFVDNASLLHGTSSVQSAGGGLGGLISLSTAPFAHDGIAAQYIQGIGSFNTFDEFARVTYGNDHWAVSTRVLYSSSDNDFKYRNHDRKENIYDDEHNIIGQYYPEERNRSGAFRDLHVMQELYYDSRRGDRIGLSAWYNADNRELPLLTVEYGGEMGFENRQRDRVFRSVMSWDHVRSGWKTSMKAGYMNSWTAYDYRREVAEGQMVSMTRSRSRVQTLFGEVSADWIPARRWFVTATLTGHQQLVKSMDRSIAMGSGAAAVIGYDCGRMELSGAVSVKWQPTERIGLSVVCREELAGYDWSPVIPALFADARICRWGALTAKASVSRNYRAPSLNDMYFMPGGNPSLNHERGMTYDIGLSGAWYRDGVWAFSADMSWFDSYIDDWIQWLPTTKGFYSPQNVKRVHAYGIEFKANGQWAVSSDIKLYMQGSYSWTPSVNAGRQMSAADVSIGKQLPYVPRHSASVTGRMTWRRWALEYKWLHYSRRYTMSSNDVAVSGSLVPYFMNNIAIERSFGWSFADLSLKGTIRNLFDEEYLSVLSRPMPGINIQLLVSVTPKF